MSAIDFPRHPVRISIAGSCILFRALDLSLSRLVLTKTVAEAHILKRNVNFNINCEQVCWLRMSRADTEKKLKPLWVPWNTPQPGLMLRKNMWAQLHDVISCLDSKGVAHFGEKRKKKTRPKFDCDLGVIVVKNYLFFFFFLKCRKKPFWQFKSTNVTQTDRKSAEEYWRSELNHLVPLKLWTRTMEGLHEGVNVKVRLTFL